MAYTIVIFNEKMWDKDASRIQNKMLMRIFARIQDLKQIPWPANIKVKALPHYKTADFRLRVDDYRVLFNKNDDRKEIQLLRVLHRSKLY